MVSKYYIVRLSISTLEGIQRLRVVSKTLPHGEELLKAKILEVVADNDFILIKNDVKTAIKEYLNQKSVNISILIKNSPNDNVITKDFHPEKKQMENHIFLNKS